ncbi:MAG: ammonia-forming cytochrome c nitrite reductase subunit c552, partial [Planctomycetota bacterium]|nr:ammonia-forming cytochrome c nitrite reductase subunit c552 [Planctomycetota bacterium]
DESGKGTLAGILTDQEQGGGGSSKQQKAGTYYLEVETEGKWAIGVRRQSDFLETVARANFRGEGAQKTRPFIMKAIDTKVAELGIACEACHGPASEHVKIHRDPALRYKKHLGEGLPDPTIQNPARMKPKEASQVCGQCHSVWYESLEEDKAKKESGYTYRPGDDLSKTREVVNREDINTETIRNISKSEPHYLADRYWSDGMIRIAGREYSGLIDSPCYTHGDPDQKKTITCMSCHTMHKSKGSADSIRQWKDDQLGEGMRGNQACLQCHEEIGAKLAEHTHHLPDSSGSECYNCHMPHTTYGLLKGIRSHTISTPSVQESVEVGRPNACNACHLDQTLHWTAGHLQSWYGIEPPELKDEQKEIAASILWALTGDAGQRALMAWAMGWKPAQETSGTDWMLPFLVPLFEGDPYHAVRYIAQRSIRSLDSQYKYLDFEKASFMKLAVDREQMRRDVVGLWEQQARAPETKRKELLFDQAGKLDKNRWSQLVRRRNNQRVNLEE